MLAKILAFLSVVPGSVKGFINAEELFRAIAAAVLASVGTGSATAVLDAVLTAISSGAASIFAGPAVPLATFGVSLVLELLRRKTQGNLVVVEPPAGTPIAVQSAIVHATPAK